MVANVLAHGGLDPTVIIGGRLDKWGSNARLGQGTFLVAEADESDGSFLHLSPSIAVVTNIDLEHLDFYRDLDHIQSTFLEFLNRLPFYGLAILCLDDPHLPSLIPKLKKRYRTYGLTAQAEVQARDIVQDGLASGYRLYLSGKEAGEIRFRLPGLHNVYNSLAAVAVGMELEVSLDRVREAFDSLEGVQRRFQIRGEYQGVTVLDDYGHHPTEIRATLNAARSCWPDRRLVVIFQPHRFSRTKALFEEFTTAFYQADSLWLLPIYAASEDPIEGIDSAGLMEGIKEKGHRDVRLLSNPAEALPILRNFVKSGEVLITLGAGDVWKIGQDFISSPQS
jgi:UDP-N-acetylmuramate--alanine ligase